MKIHILDKYIAERIAAGEVVERPASVVKELVENAIDAGASAISIEIREGGVALIRVSDNGSGMSRDDAALAVERFATSKITREDDLRAIRTLGFRGEALPAIASMAQLEILTRTKDDIEGTHVRVVDGKVETEIAGAPIGTQVVVRNLFYNAPARRKFLKAPLRESGLIEKTLVQYALAYPQIGVSVNRGWTRERQPCEGSETFARFGTHQRGVGTRGGGRDDRGGDFCGDDIFTIN